MKTDYQFLSLLYAIMLMTASSFVAASEIALAQNCTGPCNLSTSTNNTTNASIGSTKSGRSVTAINLGDNQTDVAVNPKTNKIYVTLADKPAVGKTRCRYIKQGRRTRTTKSIPKKS